MSNYGDGFIKRTGKSLSILAFETSKQSRIMKKRMRISALQKEVKADLKDLGRLVFEAVTQKRQGVLGDEEVKILVENMEKNNSEIEHLREAILRISRVKKMFGEDDVEEEVATGAVAVKEPTLEVQPEAEAASKPFKAAAPMLEEKPKAAKRKTTTRRKVVAKKTTPQKSASKTSSAKTPSGPKTTRVRKAVKKDEKKEEAKKD